MNYLMIALAASLVLRHNVVYKIDNPVDQTVLDTDYGTYAFEYENRWGIVLNEEETEMLAKIVWLEAGNQSDVGQQLVTVVVLNRILDGRFGNGLEDVLSAPNQFSTWDDLNSAEPTTKEYDNVLAVLHGNVDSWVYNAQYLYFNSLGNGEKIGGHYFR